MGIGGDTTAGFSHRVDVLIRILLPLFELEHVRIANLKLLTGVYGNHLLTQNRIS